MATSIFLNRKEIKKAYDFAKETVDKHYRRMWKSREVGIERITEGKLGEIAVANVLQGKGIFAECNFANKVDSGDLVIRSNGREVKIGVKTKASSQSFQSKRGIWFLHIPCDQYKKLFRDNIEILTAVFLKKLKIETWRLPKRAKAVVVGAISTDEYDKRKILHKGGTFPDGWKEPTPFPKPNSWALPWSELKDFHSIGNLVFIKQLELFDDLLDRY